jgi:hypothetical protein
MTRRPPVLVVVLPLLDLVMACSQTEPEPIVVAPDRPKDAGVDRRTPPAGTEPDAAIADAGEPLAEAGSTSDGPPAEAGGGEAGAPADATAGEVAGDGGAAADAGGDAGAVNEATWSYTACDKRALMFPKIDKNNGVFPIGSCPPPEGLARPCGGDSKIKVMRATAQTWETGYYHPPEYAIDEHLMTRWSSNTMVTSWLQLDLGSEQTFRRIYLAWELAHGADYDIVTSNDGTTWTMLRQVRGGNGFQDILDVEGRARYVRMNGVRRGNVGEGPYGYSLFDFTICGERP